MQGKDLNIQEEGNKGRTRGLEAAGKGGLIARVGSELRSRTKTGVGSGGKGGTRTEGSDSEGEQGVTI